MALLLVKTLLSPSLVVAVSLTARWFGPKIGGLVAGVPVVAGPALLVLALAHGAGFAARAAVGTLAGLAAIALFLLAYGRLVGRLPWRLCLPVCWLVYLATAGVLSVLRPALGAALAIAALTLAFAAWRLPRPAPQARAAVAAPPGWDLPLRAAAACGLVVSLAALAHVLGPRASGLLASFPVLASILLVFTHAQQGVEPTLRLLSGLVVGLATFGSFCFVLAATLPAEGVAVAFGIGLAAALAVQLASLVALR